MLLAPTYYRAPAYLGVSFYVLFASALGTALAIVVGLRGAGILGCVIAASALAALLVSSSRSCRVRNLSTPLRHWISGIS